MEIVIKDNKRNWQIVKDNRRFLFPPKIRLAFKICILVYVALLLINVLMHQFKLWMVFVLPMAIIILEVQIYYFAKKTINLQKEIFKKDQDDNESLKDVKVKKKKIIMKDQSNGQANIEKEVIDFEDVENLKFETFYNVGFGLFEMTSEIIYKTVYNIKFEYVIFKNCIFFLKQVYNKTFY